MSLRGVLDVVLTDPGMAQVVAQAGTAELAVTAAPTVQPGGVDPQAVRVGLGRRADRVVHEHRRQRQPGAAVGHRRTPPSSTVCASSAASARRSTVLEVCIVYGK